MHFRQIVIDGCYVSHLNPMFEVVVGCSCFEFLYVNEEPPF
jgi:hypothetical protein